MVLFDADNRKTEKAIVDRLRDATTLHDASSRSFYGDITPWVLSGVKVAASLLGDEEIALVTFDQEGDGSAPLTSFSLVTATRFIAVSQPEVELTTSTVDSWLHGSVQSLKIAPYGEARSQNLEPFPGHVDFTVRFSTGEVLELSTHGVGNLESQARRDFIERHLHLN